MNYKPGFYFILKNRLQRKNFLYEFYFRGKKTLDVGCGEGEFLKNDKELIYGVDLNERVILSLSKDGYKVKQGNMNSLPYADNEFEAIHCHNVIEHLSVEDAYSMLLEIYRVLRSGGLIVISSELVTRKFWHTFGHVKPYPPEALLKLLRTDSREKFEGISGLEPIGLFYFGNCFKNKLLYFLSILISYCLPIGRREYFLVLKKNNHKFY